MRSKTIVLIALALGCGIVAAIGVSQSLDARNKASAEQGEKQGVFVAMLDIQPNEELTAQNIKLEEWPKTIVPQGALTKLEEVEGKRCRVKLYAGEPILSSKLLGAADSTGAAKDIPDGYRVAPVKVDSTTGSSNLILPGDRVDVLLFRQPTNNNENATAAKIVLQDIKVFAVDTHTETEFNHTKTEQNEPISAKTISLLVTPHQSLILHAASEMGGSLRLVLRNPDDKNYVSTHGASLSDIFGPDERSNRDKEHGATGESGDDDITNMLDQTRTKAVTPPPPSVGIAPIAPPAPPRRMIVIMGASIKEVDLPGDGLPPTTQPTVETQPDGGMPPFGGEGDVPMAPPADPPPLSPDDPTPTNEPS